MKTLLITSGLLGLFNFSNANTTNSEAEFQEEFKNEITYPKVKSESDNEVVYISFLVKEDGTVEVEDVNASNEEFADYVKEKIEAIDLEKNDQRTGKTYYYKMTFRKE